MQSTLLIFLAFGLLSALVVWLSPRNLLFDNAITRLCLVGIRYVTSLIAVNKNPTITHFSVKSLEKRDDSFLIYSGDYFEISWHVSNAYHIALSGFGNVTGLTSVRCTADFVTSKEFALQAKGHGGDVSQRLMVSISKPSKIPTKLKSDIVPIEASVNEATPTRLEATFPSIAEPSSKVDLVDIMLSSARVSNILPITFSNPAAIIDDFVIEIQ